MSLKVSLKYSHIVCNRTKVTFLLSGDCCFQMVSTAKMCQNFGRLEALAWAQRTHRRRHRWFWCSVPIRVMFLGSFSWLQVTASPLVHWSSTREENSLVNLVVLIISMGPVSKLRTVDWNGFEPALTKMCRVFSSSKQILFKYLKGSKGTIVCCTCIFKLGHTCISQSLRAHRTSHVHPTHVGVKIQEICGCQNLQGPKIC